MQRFAERKFELILEEQENDLKQKDTEIKELESTKTLLELELSQLRSFLSSCQETMEALSDELKRDFLSVSFLRDEMKHLENLKSQLSGIASFHKICTYYVNMQSVLKYMENHAGLKIDDNSRSGGGGEGSKNGNGNKLTWRRRPKSGKGKSMHDKMQGLVDVMVNMMDDLSSRHNVSGHVVKIQLEKALTQLREIVGDVLQIQDVFKSTVRQKRKLESEVLSMLHSLQEIRRLERELKEKQTHVNELTRQGQMMRKKANVKQRKNLEQIQQNMEDKRNQMNDLQKMLERTVGSADQRLHSLFNLLPDLDDSLPRSDTELDSVMDASRTGTPSSLRLKDAGALRDDDLPTLPVDRVTTPRVRFANNVENNENKKIKVQNGKGRVSTDGSRSARDQNSNNIKSKTPRWRLPTSSSQNKSARTKDGKPAPQKVQDNPGADIDKWVSEQKDNKTSQALQQRASAYTVHTTNRDYTLPESQLNHRQPGEDYSGKLEQLGNIGRLSDRRPPSVVQKDEPPPQAVVVEVEDVITPDEVVPTPMSCSEDTSSASMPSTSDASSASARSRNYVNDNAVPVRKQVGYNKSQEEAVSAFKRRMQLGRNPQMNKEKSSVSKSCSSITVLDPGQGVHPSDAYSHDSSTPFTKESQADAGMAKRQAQRPTFNTNMVMLRLPSK